MKCAKVKICKGLKFREIIFIFQKLIFKKIKITLSMKFFRKSPHLLYVAFDTESFLELNIVIDYMIIFSVSLVIWYPNDHFLKNVPKRLCLTTKAYDLRLVLELLHPRLRKNSFCGLLG